MNDESLTHPETRPGPKTTEFWITLLASIVPLVDLAGVAELLPDRYAGLILAIVVGFYNHSRGLAKAGVPNDAVALPAVPDEAPDVEGAVVPDPADPDARS